MNEEPIPPGETPTTAPSRAADAPDRAEPGSPDSRVLGGPPGPAPRVPRDPVTPGRRRRWDTRVADALTPCLDEMRYRVDPKEWPAFLARECNHYGLRPEHLRRAAEAESEREARRTRVRLRHEAIDKILSSHLQGDPETWPSVTRLAAVAREAGLDASVVEVLSARARAEWAAYRRPANPTTAGEGHA